MTRSATGGRAALRALAALLLGLALGLAADASGSAAVLRAAAWLEPVGTLWVNAIRMAVIPLVVSALVVAVAGTGARTVGRLGTRALIIFVLLLAAEALLVAPLAPLVFARLAIDPAAAASIRAGAGVVQRPEMPTFGSWLVGLVPANPIKAAADGAMLPLIVFTLAFGLALDRVAPERRASVVGFFSGVTGAMTVLVGWVLALAPVGVFALSLALAARLGTEVVGAVGFYLAAHAALLVVALLLLYAVVALFARVPVARFARAALPAQVVAMSTRSSIAALPAMLTAAERTLGLPRAVTSFALPLAVSTFRVNQPVCWVVMGLFAARLYGVPIGPAEVATLALMAVLMSFSVPGIPSGGMFIVAPFFASVGIPPESVGVLIAVDVVADAFKTLTNVTGHLTAATLLARGERRGTRVAADVPEVGLAAVAPSP
jgi:Na+/H+-dicarboxylate symporter